MEEIERILNEELSKVYGDATVQTAMVNHLSSLIKAEAKKAYDRGWQDAMDCYSRR